MEDTHFSISACFADQLSHFSRDQPRELVAPLLDQLRRAPQEPHTLFDRRRASFLPHARRLLKRLFQT
jgi:hypothetical protein